MNIIIIIFMLLFSIANGQNLIMNADHQDQNLCCENNLYCCPSAWFPLEPGNSALRLGRTSEKYLTVNPIKHIYGINTSFTYVALLQPIFQSCTYKMTIKLPGNKDVYMLYTFVDTLIVFNNKDSAFSFIGNTAFNKIHIRGKKHNFKIAQMGGRFLLFALVNKKGSLQTSYKQRFESLSITTTQCDTCWSAEQIKTWINYVYNEKRRHDFTSECADKTLR